MNHYKVLFLLVFSLIVFTPQTQAALTMGATTLTSDGVLTVTTTGGMSVGASGLQAAVGVQGAAATAGAGTISSSATTVTGTGTAFSTEVAIGDVITADGIAVEVKTVNSDTSITLESSASSRLSPVLSNDAYTISKPLFRVTNNSGANKFLLNARGQISIGTDDPGDWLFNVKKTDHSHWAAAFLAKEVTLDNPSAKNIEGTRSQAALTSTAGTYGNDIIAAQSVSKYIGSGTSVMTAKVRGVNTEYGNYGSTTLTDAMGFYAVLNFQGGAGNITNAYGFYNQLYRCCGSSGTVTNYYTYFSANKSALATNYYHFYGGTGGYSYLPHNVGIGAGVSTTPTAYLQLGAGTATASTAPLKFTSGTNLTVAEAGAVEYDGTNLFYTDGSANRQTVASYRYAVAATANNLAYTLAVPLTALTDGSIIYFKMAAANTGGASTLNVNSLGAKKMLKGSDNATQINTNDLVANGSYSAIYNTTLDAAAGAWVILNK